MADGATFLNYWPIVFVLAEKKESQRFPIPRRANIYYNGENGRKKILYLFRLQPTIKTKQFYPFLHTSGF